MIKHIVLFKLEDNSPKHCKYIRAMILDLKDRIDVIRDFEVGINFCNEERAYDMSLISSFDSTDDLEIYAKHPDHLEVISYLKSQNTLTKVVDYVC